MELCQGTGLNLHPMVEDDHTNRRDQKKNKNAPDTLPDVAQKITAPLRADLPLAVNLNPFIYFARSDFHALSDAHSVPLHCETLNPFTDLDGAERLSNIMTSFLTGKQLERDLQAASTSDAVSQ